MRLSISASQVFSAAFALVAALEIGLCARAIARWINAGRVNNAL